MTRLLRLSLLALLLTLTACERAIVRPEDLRPRTPAAGEANPAASATAERTAALQEFTGEAAYRAAVGGDWAAAAVGQVIAVGSQVRTGPDGRVLIQLTEGSKIRLGPDTTVTFNFLNPYRDSLLTAIALDQGEVYILLTNGALDVETAVGLASARASFMSVAYQPAGQQLAISCLQGTCTFADMFVPERFKYAQTGLAKGLPERMQLADFGAWGVKVPEATRLAFYATEAVVQGSATLPVVATETPTAAPPATETPTPTLEGVPAAPTNPPALDTPTAPPTPTEAPVVATPLPRPTYTLIGTHVVQPGETLYCIARAYGVLPFAIADANGSSTLINLRPNQRLGIPAVQWFNISAGPVCAPQFASPYPGLPLPVSTPPTEPTATPVDGAPPTTVADPLRIVEIAVLCVGNCTNQEATYRVKVIVTVSGGVAPYTFSPGQAFDQDFPRCTPGTGAVTVTSADGQTATASWPQYEDVGCVPTATAEPPTPTP